MTSFSYLEIFFQLYSLLFWWISKDNYPLLLSWTSHHFSRFKVLPSQLAATYLISHTPSPQEMLDSSPYSMLLKRHNSSVECFVHNPSSTPTQECLAKYSGWHFGIVYLEKDGTDKQWVQCLSHPRIVRSKILLVQKMGSSHKGLRGISV